MIKHTVAFLFCTSTIAYAVQPFNVEKPVVCADVKTVIETITGEGYNEQPYWIGKDETSKYVLLVNERTREWTMIQFTDQIACILGTGSSSRLINSKRSKIQS